MLSIGASANGYSDSAICDDHQLRAPSLDDSTFSSILVGCGVRSLGGGSIYWAAVVGSHASVDWA